MLLTGCRSFSAGRNAVWALLTQPQALAACLPGLESFEIVIPGRLFQGVVSVTLGTARLHFPTRVEWLELRATDRATLRAETTLRSGKLVTAGAVLLGVTSDQSTELTWTADISLANGGDEQNPFLLQMVANTGRRVINTFFDCLSAKLEATFSRLDA